MSGNSQWKPFQPPDQMSPDSILDYKNMTSNGKPSQSFNFNRSASNSRFGGEFPMLQDKSPSQMSYSNGLFGSASTTHASARNFPPIGTFSLDSNSVFNSSGDSSMNATSSSNNIFSNVSNGNLNSSSSYNSNSNNSDSNPGTRETGIIEKLLHSYGFIQCCERQARLFFHFSQFTGNIEHLKIGDPVEFEMTYDRRTGKPIASAVTKIAPEETHQEPLLSNVTEAENNLQNFTPLFEEKSPFNTQQEEFNRSMPLFEDNSSFEENIEIMMELDNSPLSKSDEAESQDILVMSEERVTGTVTTEVRGEGSSGDTMGRISYENRGECFFLPYTKDDVEGNVVLRSGDRVSFQIATNNRGNLGACHVRLENPKHPVKYQGVVCSLKDSFGFIERADVVKEIFFHFSEAKTKEELRLGDDVEYIIQTRNGKEVACNITKLPPGTVIFEDLKPDILKGQVTKAIDKNLRTTNEPLPGRITYKVADSKEIREISFSEKDQEGDFTLRYGDWVKFQIATDRRDALDRATHIVLLEESFQASGEKREQGVVASIKEGFGFLKCVEREARLFFHFNEILDVNKANELQVGDEFEFTVVQDQMNTYTSAKDNRQSAIRMKWLPPGTVQFEIPIDTGLTGTITKEIPNPNGWLTRSPTKNQQQQQNGTPEVVEPGLIGYQVNGIKKTITYYGKDCDIRHLPRLGDKVKFDISQVKRTKEFIATGVEIMQSAMQSNGIKHNTSASQIQRSGSVSHDGKTHQGFLAALKDGFGFIETISHDKEVFFHFSNFEGDSNTLELGQEVEYNLGTRGNSGTCSSAENVKIVPKGTIDLPAVNGEVLEGVVVRPLRSVNPDQNEYSGLIRIRTENPEEKSPEYEFGIMGLVNKRELLQVGDLVQFQADSTNRAANIIAVRKKLRATVDAIKGHFGFLAYEVEEGKKLFFHMTEVKDNATLNVGDTVEFVLVTNQRSGKSSACNVVKVNDVQARPERLISRLRTVSLDDTGPRMIAIRQPKGPDGSKGFTQDIRTLRLPGMVLE